MQHSVRDRLRHQGHSGAIRGSAVSDGAAPATPLRPARTGAFGPGSADAMVEGADGASARMGRNPA